MQGRLISNSPQQLINHIVVDSREQFQANSLFIAIKGERFNGHNFIEELTARNLNCFLVDEQYDNFSENISYIIVRDTLKAFQKLAQHHRVKFNYPIIGITGSNGKTIVKEWLYQLLAQDFSIVKSPKSYNSQIGVPLSIINMNVHHTLGIFEAGISKTNEMQQLSEIVQPTIGIFTNLGSAHNEGFSNNLEKLNEKAKLFQTASTIIVQADTKAHNIFKKLYSEKNILAWQINNSIVYLNSLTIKIPQQFNRYEQENLAHCIALLLYFNYKESTIIERVKRLESVENRLQISNAENNVTVINDSYNNDLAGLEIALKYANEQANGQRFSVIVSFIEQSGLSNAAMQQQILSLLNVYPIHKLVLIGEQFKIESNSQNIYKITQVEQLDNLYQSFELKDEVLLIKGARKFQLENFASSIIKKLHDTVWEINLSAFVNNINVFRELLQPSVKMMVMVKAFAYGSSPKQLAKLLQHQHIDYLGVAYPSEGKDLREYGIDIPIMVMNTSKLTFETAVKAHLEIEVYSLNHLRSLIDYLRFNGIKSYPIHLKIDTGMNRLGFAKEDVCELIEMIQKPEIFVKGIFSHLATSDEKDDSFALQQQALFDALLNKILPHCTKHPIIHLLNTNGIANKRLKQYNMVRLGIGAYGISSKEDIQQRLVQIGTLKATISQIKEIQKGESVGYSRSFVAPKPTKIAIITIGYADGLDRRLSNGVGYVLINDQLAPIIGTVCMDMTMIDVTNIKNVTVGNQVIITSPKRPITELAESIGTISYELLTKISPRIPRVFITQ